MREKATLSVVLEEQVPAVLLDLLVQLGLDLGVSGNVVVGLSIHKVSGRLGSSDELSIGRDDQTVNGSVGSLQLGDLLAMEVMRF